MSGSRADAGIAAAPCRPAARTGAAMGALAIAASFLITASVGAETARAPDTRVPDSHVQDLTPGAPIRLAPDPSANLFSAAPPAAVAPSTAPLSLRPPAGPPVVAPDAASPSTPSGAPAPPSFTVDPRVPPPPAVTVAPIGPIDPDGAGTLSGAQGLGDDPWKGITRAEVLRLLPRLPIRTPSAAVKTLERRLLLSAGPLQAAAGEPEPPRRYAALRVETLAALGDPRGAAALAALLPVALDDEGAASALIDAELIAGPLDCARAGALIRRFKGAFWEKLKLYCALRAGDRAGAALALDLLREQPAGDEAFAQVADALAGGPRPRLRTLPSPSVITLSALRTLQMGPPPDVLSLTDPARLAAVGNNPATDPMTRVIAAERAAAALFLDARQLAEAYAAAPGREDERLRLADLAERDPSARVRGIVHQAFNAAIQGERRIAMATLAVRLVDPALLDGPLGAAVATLVDTVTPSPDAAGLAPDAARLYLALGRVDDARRWYGLALRTHPTADVAPLWPLAIVVAGAPPAGVADGMAVWLDEVLRGDDPAARARTAGQLALLQAMGVAVPEAAWQRTSPDAKADAKADNSPPGAANAALWRRLGEAAATGRVGETVLTSLLLLGERGPAAQPPDLVARVVASLRAVGLEDSARAVAREASVALIHPQTARAG